MKNEIWKPIDGYDHPYKVSNHGRVLGKYGVLRPYDNGYGYLVVDFRKYGIKGEPADEELLRKLDNDFCSCGERKDNEI